MDDLEKPSKPAASGKSDTKYEFNLGLYRIETISEILNICAKKYRRAIMEREQDAIHDYQAMVNVLYTETYIYMQEETGFQFREIELDKDEVLEQYLDDFSQLSGEDNKQEHLQNIRKIYLSLRKLLQNVGIDIPEEEKIGETEVFG